MKSERKNPGAYKGQKEGIEEMDLSPGSEMRAKREPGHKGTHSLCQGAAILFQEYWKATEGFYAME